MQTFLAYPDFVKSAQCLDSKRLGKQRVECLQILKALTMPDYGWKNHPIVKMWKGYEMELCNYGWTICEEWTKRGFLDTVGVKIYESSRRIRMQDEYLTWMESWLGNESFHLSHQSNLLRKDYAHYSKYFPNVPNDLPYQWYNPETKLFYTTISK